MVPGFTPSPQKPPLWFVAPSTLPPVADFEAVGGGGKKAERHRGLWSVAEKISRFKNGKKDKDMGSGRLTHFRPPQFFNFFIF